MPTLPEIEVWLHNLKPLVNNQKFSRVELLNETAANISNTDLNNKLFSTSLKNVSRYGKSIIFNFSDHLLLVHLGDNFILKLNPTATNSTDILRLKFENDLTLVISDNLRKTSFEYVFKNRNLSKIFKNIGEDIATFDAVKFKNYIQKALHAKSIKHFLLCQSHIAGFDEIYVDEIFFRSRMRPMRKLSSLSQEEIDNLYAAIFEVLEEAIKYTRSDLGKGFEKVRCDWLKVSSRNKKSCVKCGKPIRSVVVDGFQTYYCFYCQH